MVDNKYLIPSIVVPVTLGFAGLFYYLGQTPKTDAEKHLDLVKQNPDSNLIYTKNSKFLTFGGSTRRHKKGNKHTKKHRKN